MNEYWQAENSASFCFCYDGEWFQVKADSDDSPDWEICAVTVEGGLPVEMKEHYYNEVGIEEVLESTKWTEEQFEAQIAAQLNQVD